MSKAKNKKIYIVLTHTGTVLSKMVKLYTRADYSHVSISLDEKLEQMYSFGRLYKYNPFIGGFVHENVKWGTFERFKNIRTTVCSIEVDDKQYEKIKKTISKLKQENEEQRYTFNIIGLFAVALHMRKTSDRGFYCAEFVKYVLDEAGVENDLPDIVKPVDFLKLNNINEVYSGMFREYLKI